MGGSEVASIAVGFLVTIVSVKEVTGIIIPVALIGDATPGLVGTSLTYRVTRSFR